MHNLARSLVILAALIGVANATSIPVHTATPVVFVGDSITFQGWFASAQSQVSGTNLLVDQLSSPVVGPRAASIPAGAVPATVVTSSPRPVVNSISAGGQIGWVNSGISQQKIGDVESVVPARITNWNPSVVVIQFGINDAVPPLAPFTATPLATFRASYDDVLSQILTANASTAIICVSVFVHAENWNYSNGTPVFDGAQDAGPSNPSYTPSIPQYNAQIQASCVAHGGQYADLRTPAVAYEVINNAPAPGSSQGPLTIDGKHPSAIGQQLIFSDTVVPFFSFSP